jgi:hypothetical protein
MAQALHIANGDTLNDKLAAKDNRVEKLLASGMTDTKIIEEVYLSAVSRLPSEKEQAQVLKVLADAKPDERRKTLEDVFWGLMSAREFLFNH